MLLPLSVRRQRRSQMLILASLIFLMLCFLPPLDYKYFSETARYWRDGTSRLYDSITPNFFYAPWTLLLIVPLSFLPDQIAQALLNMLTLLSVAWGTLLLVRPIAGRPLMLALVSPYLAAVLILGQWDGLIIGGVALAWFAVTQRRPWLLGLALLIITTKPTNALLSVVLILYAVHRWPLAAWLRMLALPALAGAAAFLACGLDWPLRYLRFIQITPPRGFNVSLLEMVGVVPTIVIGLAALAWFIWATRRGVSTGRQLVVAMLVSMLISPYVVPYHYVGTVPALALVAQRSWRLGLLAWLIGAVAFFAFIIFQSAALMPVYLLLICAAGMYFCIAPQPAADESAAPAALV